MKKISLAVLSIAVLLTVAALAADVSGTWVMSTPGRDGQMREQDITIAQDGNKIKVTMTMGRPGGETREMVGEGTIEGNAIQWAFTFQRPDGQEMKMEYKGTVDGATMKGTTSRMGNEVEWTAKKK
jgi:opacity protein-like surface antigen